MSGSRGDKETERERERERASQERSIYDSELRGRCGGSGLRFAECVVQQVCSASPPKPQILNP